MWFYRNNETQFIETKANFTDSNYIIYRNNQDMMIINHLI